MKNSTLLTLTPAEAAFKCITKIILELEDSEFEILENKRYKNLCGLA